MSQEPDPTWDDFNTILRPSVALFSEIYQTPSAQINFLHDSSVTDTDNTLDTSFSSLPPLGYRQTGVSAASFDAPLHGTEENVVLSANDNLISLAERQSTSTTPLTSTSLTSTRCTPSTPENEHHVSALPTSKLNRRKYVCELGCSMSFLSRKDRRRHHISTTHADADMEANTEPFQCRCGYSTRRKDHYRRHLERARRCEFKQAYFQCICKNSVLESDLQQHLQHINMCTQGRGVSGRPKKQQLEDVHG